MFAASRWSCRPIPTTRRALLISAIEDADPVIFFEPKRIYSGPFDGESEKAAVPWSSHPKGEVPAGHYSVPLGRAEIIRPGKDLTVATYGHHGACGSGRRVARAAARTPRSSNLRTLAPLDTDTLCGSVNRTGRCVIVP